MICPFMTPVDTIGLSDTWVSSQHEIWTNHDLSTSTAPSNLYHIGSPVCKILNAAHIGSLGSHCRCRKSTASFGYCLRTITRGGGQCLNGKTMILWLEHEHETWSFTAILLTWEVPPQAAIALLVNRTRVGNRYTVKLLICCRRGVGSVTQDPIYDKRSKKDAVIQIRKLYLC